MAKYFDPTFFKFLKGFLVILCVSFLILYVSQRWGTDPQGGGYVETDASTSENSR